MTKMKKALALILLMIYTVGMMSACGDNNTSQPQSAKTEEIYLTTSNISEYLDVKVELVQYDNGYDNAMFEISTVGRNNIIYKDVEITYNLNSNDYNWLDANDETLRIAQDGMTSANFFPTHYITSSLQAPEYTLDITFVKGSVLVQ